MFYHRIEVGAAIANQARGLVVSDLIKGPATSDGPRSIRSFAFGTTEDICIPIGMFVVMPSIHSNLIGTSFSPSNIQPRNG